MIIKLIRFLNLAKALKEVNNDALLKSVQETTNLIAFTIEADR